MGWGILGGAAVNEYTKQQQIARDNEWRDLQKQQLTREMQQQQAQDDAVQQGAADASQDKGGSVISTDLIKQTLPGIDDASASQLADQLSSADPVQANTILQQARQRFQPPAQTGQPGVATAPAPAMRTSTFGDQGQSMPNAMGDTPASAPDATADTAAPQAATAGLPTAPLRVYKGHDGKSYLTAGADTPPSQGEIMLAQSRRLLSGAAGFKGVQAGALMQQQAMEVMKHEQAQKLNSIMTGPLSFDQKVGSLLQMVNGSPVTPGSLSLQKGADGSLYAVHNVPGHNGDFKFKLNGSSPDEMLGDLAMRVQAMTNPDIMMKRLEMQQKDRSLSNEEARTGIEQQNANETARYHKDAIGAEYAGIHSREGIAAMETSARSADRAESRAARLAMSPSNQKIDEINFIAKSMLATGEAKTMDEAVRAATKQVIHPMVDKGQGQAGEKVNSDGSMTVNGVIYDPPAKPGQPWQKRVLPGEIESKLPPPGANLFGPTSAPAAPARSGSAGISFANPMHPAGPATSTPQSIPALRTGAPAPSPARVAADKQQAAALLAEGQQEYTVAQRRMELAQKSLPANSPSLRTAVGQAQGDMARALAKIQAAQAATQ